MQFSNEDLIDLFKTKYLTTGVVLFFKLATLFLMFHRTIVRVIYITSFSTFFFSMWMIIDEKAILEGNIIIRKFDYLNYLLFNFKLFLAALQNKFLELCQHYGVKFTN